MSSEVRQFRCGDIRADPGSLFLDLDVNHSISSRTNWVATDTSDQMRVIDNRFENLTGGGCYLFVMRGVGFVADWMVFCEKNNSIAGYCFVLGFSLGRCLEGLVSGSDLNLNNGGDHA